MSEIQKLLLEAKKVLVEKGWTQKASARDKDLEPVDSLSKKASCYCSIGALNFAESKLGCVDGLVSVNAAKLLCKEINKDTTYPFYNLIQWNDSHLTVKAEVIEVFNRAIYKAGL